MYKILIAEKESIERRMLCRILSRQFGDEVELLEARNGREAVELALAEKPRVAILDIDMPGVTGLEVARHIRRERLNCMIIFLSAYDHFGYARQAIAVQAWNYLLKPYDRNELLSTVEAAMHLSDRLAKNKIYLEFFPRVEEPAPERTGERGDSERLGSVRERIEAYIEENYAADLSLQSISQALNYSEAYFCKLFKQCFRVNFSAYLNDYRIARAKELLADTDMGVKDVSYACGYADSSYFARVFKRHTGQTPSDYRLTIQGME
ncbi:MAG: helix-turn-helix domain-containing protein [Oscillospiraceae bacterium]|nr:helix-turn-helix domain-containing protein [Oscillospiraceae bacterium]